MDMITWIYIALISITCITSSVNGRTTSSVSRTYQRQQRCSYLHNDGNQHNAYSHLGLDGSFCCFCPRGTEWVGDCHPDNPSSTQCKACGPDHYIDFEPHLEPKCYPKRERHCHSPKVYFKGSEYEEDRCVCPTGMYEDKTTETCHPVSSVTPPTIPLEPGDVSTTGEDQSTTPEALAEPQTPLPHPTDSLLSPSASTAKGSLRGTSSTNFPDKFTANDDPLRGLPWTREKSKDTIDMGTGEIAGYVALGMVALALVSGIFYLTKKYSGCSSDPSSSNTKLNADDPTSSCKALTDGSTGPAVHESTNMHVERPLLTNQCSRNEGFEEDDALSVQEKAETIPPEEHENFAKDIAIGLGAKCVRKDALVILRRIVGNKDSNALDDVFRKNQDDTQEMFYQAMSLAIRSKGEVLTPFYIWEKVRLSNLRQYTKIVENEIERVSSSS